jgi:hypothetical protein
MTPRELRQICWNTWGRGWARHLAELVHVHPVTVRRWQSGQCAMEPWMREAILLYVVRASYRRHREVKRLVQNVKSPSNTKSVKGGAKPLPPIMVPPWANLKKAYVDLDKF